MNTPNKFDLVWNEEKKLAEITRGVNYSSKSSPSPKSDGLRRAIISNKLAIEIDGKKMELYGYLIDGYNYYKLRDLQNLLGYKMEWREKEELIDLLLPSLR